MRVRETHVITRPDGYKRVEQYDEGTLRDCGTEPAVLETWADGHQRVEHRDRSGAKGDTETEPAVVETGPGGYRLAEHWKGGRFVSSTEEHGEITVEVQT